MVREIVAVFVKLPEVPVMVTVNVPVPAALLAVRVNALVPVVLVGLNDAVTPLGRPDADKLTLPLKPFSGLTVMELEPLAPCGMVKVFGDAERLKFGGAFTASEIVAALDKLADEPVTVTVKVPVVAVLLAVKVNVLVPVVLPGLKDAVTPVGRPEADKVTALLKPFCGVMVRVLAPLEPCRMVKLLGAAEIVKFPCGFTARETLAVLVRLPEVPVTVMVKVPTVAVPLADKVKTLEAVAGFVPKLALMPLGMPEADKFTLPLNPFTGLTVMVVEPAAPWRIATLEGDAERVKLGCVAEVQLLTRFAALTVPMPVAKSQPVLVP